MSNWVVRLKLNHFKLIIKQIRLNDIIEKIEQFNLNIFCIYTDNNANNLIIRIQFKNNFFTEKKEQYYIIKDFIDKILSNDFSIKGIPNIVSVEMREKKMRSYNKKMAMLNIKKNFS